MTHASTIAVPFTIAVLAIFGCLCLILRHTFRRDEQEETAVVPAWTLAQRYPLPEPDQGRAEIGVPAAPRRRPAIRAVVDLPGYGRHDVATAIGATSQRGPDENTEALGWRAIVDLLEVR